MTAATAAGAAPAPVPGTLPRIGLLGCGWIGRLRLGALARSGAAQIAALADPVPAQRRAAADEAPAASVVGGLEELLALELDGIVIATPSALHAEQATAALERGLAVFCQKPLARTAEETGSVVAAARRANRLLGVDFSYRFTAGMQRIVELLRAGEIGPVYAADLVFHNAYGPDKPWFYDRELSGGGCVMDLGIHLVDLGLWTLGDPPVDRVSSRLFARGEPLRSTSHDVEDFAAAQLDLADGTVVRLACSWHLSAGCDAAIEATFYGRRGGLSFRNVGGSFFDFRAERFEGTRRHTLVEPPDDWGGRALVAWARRLAERPEYDPAAASVVDVARVVDRIYGR
jgi:predicted dehydrogenase